MIADSELKKILENQVEISRLLQDQIGEMINILKDQEQRIKDLEGMVKRVHDR